ncbi:MAG: TonB-dependent receptor [Longimicrobiales bacterium]
MQVYGLLCSRRRISAGIPWWPASLLLLVVLLPVASTAQETGTVGGRVVGIDGQPLVGVTVSVEATRLLAATDKSGAYSIGDVPAGAQIIEARLAGFRTVTQEVTVTARAAASVDFTLEVDILNLDSIVVTGSISPYQKIQSSIAVTTMTAQQIRDKAPLSTAHLLEEIPGFWVESSGGEGSNNLYVRGLPQPGGFRYVAMYEDGLPIFEPSELSFINPDLLMRVDETVQSMEAVRGGTASIFASNAPGGLINFVTNTGGERREGLIRITLGDYDLFRLDADYGGPIGEKWRFNIGGFVRSDDGIRDPGFTANEGGQVKANLTRLFDNGYLRFYGKLMDEENIFYLPVPLQNPKDPTGVPGFDPNFGTLTSRDAAEVQIPTPEGVIDLDLTDGMNPELRSLTGELYLELGTGWAVRDALRFTSADVSFNAIFSFFDPVDANLYPLVRFGFVPGVADSRYRFTNFPDEVFDPATANANGLVVESAWANIVKPVDNFVNDLRLTKKFTNHAFTVGLYFSDYSADERWIFNLILQEVRDRARLLDLELLDADGDVLAAVTQNGFTQYGLFHVSASSDAQVGALYLSDEWQASEKLRIDTGIRFERADFSGRVEELSRFDLGDPTTLADDAVEWGTGTFLPYDHDFDETALSVGLNYSLTPNLAVYGRWSDGFRMPDFDQWIFGNVTDPGVVEEISQIEGGVKYSSPRLGAFATVFRSVFDNLPIFDIVIDPETGQVVTLQSFAATEAIGAELELVAQILRDFRIGITSTIQEPEFDDFRITLFGEESDFSGKQVSRIPELLISITPSYRVGPFGISGTYLYVAERFADEANTVRLPSYEVIDGAISYDVSPDLRLKLFANNLTNEIGLTEGNPRTGTIVGVQRQIFMGRPILGRSFRLAATYRF